MIFIDLFVQNVSWTLHFNYNFHRFLIDSITVTHPFDWQTKKKLISPKREMRVSFAEIKLIHWQHKYRSVLTISADISLDVRSVNISKSLTVNQLFISVVGEAIFQTICNWRPIATFCIAYSVSDLWFSLQFTCSKSHISPLATASIDFCIRPSEPPMLHLITL